MRKIRDSGSDGACAIRQADRIGSRTATAPRRGMTSLLAMLFLVVFAAMALGFYASTNVGAQIAANDRRTSEAQAAADSGLQFVRHHLGQITIPSATKWSSVFEEVYMALATNLEGRANLGGRIVGYDPGNPNATPPIPGTIDMPEGGNEFIDLGNGLAFRATLIQSGRQLKVKVTGRSGLTTSCARAFEITFNTVERNTSVFNWGIASPGPVVIDSTGVIQGSPTSQANILSTYKAANPITIGTGTGGGTMGTITTITGYPPVLMPNVTVGGTTDLLTINSTHVKTIAPAAAPEWPVADTAEFKPYAKNTYSSLNTLHENILIKANTNPTFADGHTVRGIVYIEQPNVVKFNGKVTIQALIVTEDSGVGNITTPTNQVYFAGNGGAKLPLEGLLTLDRAKYGFLSDYIGSFVIAPGFDVYMAGNFGTINGNIAGDKVTITGNATATINGSVIALKPNQLQIGGSTTITMQPYAGGGHAGLRFNHFYAPDRSSYVEVKP